VLARAITASVLPTQVLLGAVSVHADSVTIPTPDVVSASATCHHSATASLSCVGTLKVERNGAPRTPTAGHAAAVQLPPRSCHYEPDFTYDTSAAVRADGGPSQFAVARLVCFQPSDQVGTPFRFTALGPKVPGVDIRALVDQASKAMNIPLPKASLSPAAGATQFVGLSTWMWMPASSWVPKSVTVSAGGVSLTMTATPAFSVWSMGDGGSVTCRGPGTPYPSASSGKPPRSSPDCGWTYARASVSEPGGVFPVSVTTHWKVSWSTTTGLSGSEPDLTVSSSLGLRVSEIQALVTDVRP
jgi:hypothetical protein